MKTLHFKATFYSITFESKNYQKIDGDLYKIKDNRDFVTGIKINSKIN